MSTIFSELDVKSLKRKHGTKLTPLARWEANWGYIFLAPWIIGFLAFILIPTVASLVFSFTDFNLIHPEEMTWIGLDNYIRFFRDPIVLVSIKVSFTFAAISLPIGIITPILLSALLNSKNLRGRRFFVTLFYLPYIVPLVSAVYIWQGVMNPQTGWINLGLKSIGIIGPDWLNSTAWIYPALLIIGLWGVGNAMLFTLTAMQGIPTELYEAAKVDGAGAVTQFRHITLPLITPIIFYNLILSVIGILQYFIVAFVLKGNNGDPGNSTMFFALQLYKQAFSFSDMGYGATMAWMLFVVTMILTLFLFRTAKYWVYYAAEDR